MSLITRQGKGSKLTIQEMDGNLEYLEGLAQGGSIPVETTYPTTDALKAGKRFLYKGNQWHYMTENEINSTGWTGFVSVGFPAPISKKIDKFLYFSEEAFTINAKNLNLDCSGASSLKLIGMGQNLNVDISGASNINTLDYKVATANIDASGASDVKVFVTSKIVADASGASSVRYKGGASVKSSTSGAGSVKTMN